MDPVVGNGEVASNPVRRLCQGVAAVDLVDDPVTLMNSRGERQIPHLGREKPSLTGLQPPQRGVSGHAGLLRPAYQILGLLSWVSTRWPYSCKPSPMLISYQSRLIIDAPSPS